MELRRYLVILRARWLLLLAFTVGAVILVVLLTPGGTQYRAESTLYIGSRSISLAPDSIDISADRSFGLERLAKTFAAMIDSESIASQAVAATSTALSASDVVAATSVDLIPDTQLLRISVIDPDPVTAQAIANSLAEVFVESVQEFEPGQTAANEGDLPSLPAYVFETARVPTVPEPDGLFQKVFAAAVLGLGLGIAVVLLLDYLDVSIRGPQDVEDRLGILVLGTMPDLGDDLARRPARPTG